VDQQSGKDHHVSDMRSISYFSVLVVCLIFISSIFSSSVSETGKLYGLVDPSAITKSSVPASHPINLPNKQLVRMLINACIARDIVTIESLYNCCLLDQHILDKNGNTLLHYAAYGGSASFVRFLIKNEFPIMATNSKGETPLHWISPVESSEITQLLIDHGAYVDAQSNDGNTPLHHAASAGRLPALLCLLSNGADFNVKNKSDHNPFDHYLASGIRKGAVE